VSVRPSTWYVLRVTARNAAGSADCYLKFQTARHDATVSATPSYIPHRVIVRYQPPFYERIEVIISFCGVVVSVILIAVAVAVYWRRRHELQAEQRAAKVRCSLTSDYYGPRTSAIKQEISANARETRDSISLISYVGCHGLYPVISAKIHSLNVRRSLKS